MLVLIYESLPIALFVLYSTSEQIESDLLIAAGSLGARPRSRFRHVVLPLSTTGLFTAFVLVFVPMCGAFVEPQVLGRAEGAVARQHDQRPADHDLRAALRRLAVDAAAARASSSSWRCSTACKPSPAAPRMREAGELTRWMTAGARR